MRFMYTLIAASLAMISTNSMAADTGWRDHIDFARADLSPFSLRLIKEGTTAGSMTYGWRREGNHFIIQDRTEMQPNILETATGILDATTLMPKSVDIDFAIGENRTVFDFDWDDGSLSGNITINRADQPERVVPVNSNDNAVLRLAVFGLISALPLTEGFQTELPWFNTLSNSLETVHIIHAGREKISTPAGTFDTHKINLKGGTPENIVYVTTSVPQKIVRIDVVGQPLHFELNPS